ncbi:MAG: hypothetical protein AAGD00_08455 [Planctomycetota bacterium]
MNRDRIRFDPGPGSTTFDSDRETLPFPAGGVFGTDAPHDAPVTDAAEMAQRAIERMQSKLDDLREGIDVVFKFEQFDESDTSFDSPGGDGPRAA